MSVSHLFRRWPTHLFAAWALLVLTVGLSAQVAVSLSLQEGLPGETALDREWPEGVDLLAGREIAIAGGTWHWRVSTLEADADGVTVETGHGVIAALADPILVGLDGNESVRLEPGAARGLAEGTGLRVLATGDDPVRYLRIELLPGEPGEATEDVYPIGPLSLGEGMHTLAFVNIAHDAPAGTADALLEDAVRPGVSIVHNEDGIPEVRDPAATYDTWVAVLYPSADVSIPDSPPTATVIVPNQSAPVVPLDDPTPVPTAAVSPTSEATATNTPTVTPTNTPTATVTVTPTNTPTVTPTATPTNTPTVTPTATVTVTPTNTPTVTPTVILTPP